jgi:hypothetical protein
VRILFLCVCWMLMPSDADACTCSSSFPGPSPAELTRQAKNELKEAFAVFVGQPIAMNTLMVRLRVESVWKGELGSQIVMPTGAEVTPDGSIRSSTCDMSFSTDHVYLVFAYGKTLETMKAHACGFTAPLQFTKLPDVLDRIVKRHEPPSVMSARDLVFVVGDIARPGLVAWREGLTVADAVALAGGRVPARHPEFAHLNGSSRVIRWRKAREEFPALAPTVLLPDDQLSIVSEVSGKESTGRRRQ